MSPIVRGTSTDAPHQGVEAPASDAARRTPPLEYDEIPLPLRKRVFDIVVTSLTSPIWLPCFVVGCVANRVFAGSPIFYRSLRRVGGHRSANVVKFRTMVRNADAIANRKTVPVEKQRFLNIASDSPLYTGVGRWIERLHFTEVPQFLQVLRGELSIVGNRPLPEDVIDALREKHPDVQSRFDVRCGMTGPIQLVGRNAISDRDRLELEAEYCRVVARNYSVLLDALILALTLPVALGVVRSLTVEQTRELVRRFSRPESA